MGAKGGNQTTTVQNQLDPQAQALQGQVYDAARQAAGLGPTDPNAAERQRLQALLSSPLSGPIRARLQAQLNALPPAPMAGPGAPPPDYSSVIDSYRGAIGLGQTGQAALGGDAGALAKFMNPEVQNVIDASRAGYEQLRSSALNDVADRFTRNGAWGGSRSAVASGVAEAQVAKDQAAQEAGLRYQANADAIQRAIAAINAGMGAAGALPGVYDATDPRLRQLRILQGAAAGTPYGTSSTTTQPTSQNAGAGALGGALQGYQMFGPWGAAGGALLGSGLLG